MQRVVIDEPYTFVPPRFSRFWYRVLSLIVPRNLRKNHGVTKVECVGAEKLRASLDAGHGVLIVPNHCRPCDPVVLDSLATEVRRPFHSIGNWHLFANSRFQRFVLPRVGGFSVYREGTDRESLRCAIKTVADAKFPLIVLIEGIVTRCNDRLFRLMDGPAFMARAAAKKRRQGKVVVHPVFVRYFFEGDLEQTVTPVVEEIERRLSWQPQTQLPLRERIIKTGKGLLAVKEIEYLGSPQAGSHSERLQRLTDHVLARLEEQWIQGPRDEDIMGRVKRLRTAILPGMINGGISEEERASRWRNLADVYFAQQLHCHPGDYLDEPTPERLLETVERYEEDLTDVARPHPPIRGVITVGDAIEVEPKRERGSATDPITDEIRRQLEDMMESSKAHRRVAPTNTTLS